MRHRITCTVNSPTLQEALYVPETQEGAYSVPSLAEYTTMFFIKKGLALTKRANPFLVFLRHSIRDAFSFLNKQKEKIWPHFLSDRGQAGLVDALPADHIEEGRDIVRAPVLVAQTRGVPREIDTEDGDCAGHYCRAILVGSAWIMRNLPLSATSQDQPLPHSLTAAVESGRTVFWVAVPIALFFRGCRKRKQQCKPLLANGGRHLGAGFAALDGLQGQVVNAKFFHITQFDVVLVIMALFVDHQSFK